MGALGRRCINKGDRVGMAFWLTHIRPSSLGYGRSAGRMTIQKPGKYSGARQAQIVRAAC